MTRQYSGGRSYFVAVILGVKTPYILSANHNMLWLARLRRRQQRLAFN